MHMIAYSGSGLAVLELTENDSHYIVTKTVGIPGEAYEVARKMKAYTTDMREVLRFWRAQKIVHACMEEI